MTEPSTSNNTDATGEPADIYRKKWESIFSASSDLYINEELDYEYSDGEDISNSFPLSYTWSPSSSVSSSSSSSDSSRDSSSIATVINLISDEDDYGERQCTIKKLTRDFSKLYRLKKDTIPPHFRKSWKKNTDFKGFLRRWRIRSLDMIFTSEQQINHTSRVPERPLNKLVVRNVNNQKPDLNAIADVSIVINNDLCPSVSGFRSTLAISEPLFIELPPQNSNQSCKFTSGPSEPTLVPAQKIPVNYSNPPVCDISKIRKSGQAVVQQPTPFNHRGPATTTSNFLKAPPCRRALTSSISHRYVAHSRPYSQNRTNETSRRCESANLAVMRELPPTPRPPPYPVAVGGPSTSFRFAAGQYQRSVPEELRELRELISAARVEPPRDRDVCKPFDIFCHNFLNHSSCYDGNCALSHIIPRNFDATVNSLDYNTLMISYDYIRKKAAFKLIFPYYAEAVSLKHKLEVLLGMINDILLVDVSLVNFIIKSMLNLGMRFREAIDLIINRGVCDRLNDHLLAVLTSKNLDNWDLIVKLFNQRRTRVPIVVISNILNLVICRLPVNRDLCQAINTELFERQQVDIRNIPHFLYNSFLELLISQ